MKRITLTLTLMFISPAAAMAQKSPEPPISDPAPASPIDRPKSSAPPKPEVQIIEEPSPPIPPRAPGVWWAGWTLGSGYGWHGEQQLEAVDVKKAGAAFGFGAMGHFGPEVGYQYSDRLAFTLQTRHQVTPRKSSDQTVQATSKRWGHTVLAKAAYRYPRERYQLYAGGVLGGGSGFRFRIDPQPSAALPASDTVRGGPVVFGPVGGVIWPLADRLSLVGELRLMAGAPDLAAMADFNLGLQFNL